MYPEILHIGPFVLRSYSVMLDLGIALGLIVGYLEARRLKFPLERMIDVILVVLVGGVIGARLYFVAVNWWLFETDLLGIFRLWDGGLVLHGAIIGGVLAAALYLRRIGTSFFWVADFGILGGLVAQGIGRLGCLLNGCCYGAPTSLPWGISFPLTIDDVPRHPTQLYEFTGDFVVFGILWVLRKRKPFDGFIFSLYLILYSLLRFIVEFWRGDPAEAFGDLRFAQVMSLTVLAVGLALMGYLYRRAQRVTAPEQVHVVQPSTSSKEDV